MDGNLAERCLPCKPYSANGVLGHSVRVKTNLQKLFMRRLAEELKNRGLSQNALADLSKETPYEIGQTTISAILKGKHDPKLGTVYSLSRLLDIPAWSLLIEPEQVEQRVIRPSAAAQQKVVRLGGYPSVLPAKKPKIPSSQKSFTKKTK